MKTMEEYEVLTYKISKNEIRMFEVAPKELQEKMLEQAKGRLKASAKLIEVAKLFMECEKQCNTLD